MVSGGVRGRAALPLLFVVMAVALLTSLVFFTSDISPAFSKVMSRMEDLEGIVKGNLQVSEQVAFPFDQVMRAPVGLEQDDPRLIQRIRARYLIPPSAEPYSFPTTIVDPSMGQSKQIQLILGDKVKEGGFFIECGALDGTTRSNSLVFEKKFGWKGVLIEGDPKNFEMVLKKNRKAWTVKACLSTKPYPNVVMFRQNFNLGKISDLETSMNKVNHVEVQCLPLYSILLALNTTTVDYFSLDVEGAELKVLKTIPWDKVNIKTLSVEWRHTEEGKDNMRRYMEGLGYQVFKGKNARGIGNDFIFVKKGLMPHKDTGEHP